jgi:Ca-activated chloride channel homolog
MDFLAPLALAGALLAVPIILLYMLRLRRREVTISSTYLWQQVLQDREANTPWQRLKRNLLLLLQLIILLLLVLALMRPFLTVPAVGAGQITVLLDATASMNATDISDGLTRFAEAQRRALEIVDTLGEGDHMTVIRVSDVPQILASASTDRSALRAAINAAEPGLAAGDWNAALNLAAAGGTEAEELTIVIISDGGLPATAGLPGVDGEVRYIPVGAADDNVAISALAARSLPGQPPQLYAEITNYGSIEARVVFTLFVDGERFAASNQTIPTRGSQSVISSALPADFATIEARLTPSVNAIAPDYLAADDVAYAVSGQTTTRRVLVVTAGNIYLEQALRSLPGVEAVRTTGEGGIPPDYDLYVFDNVLPQSLPDGDLMFVNPPGSTDYFTLGAENTQTSNPRVETGDDRMIFVELDQLNVLRFREVSGVEWAVPLLSVNGGPLLLAGEIDGRQVALMPFNLRESDLPLQIGWPVLMANLMEWFTPRAAITAAESLHVGESLAIRPPFGADTIRIQRPDGETDTLLATRDLEAYARTDQPGIYTIEVLRDGEVAASQPVAVNLFSALESDITPVALEDLRLEGTTITIAGEPELGQREYWPLAALLALLVLLIEWYVYHRRLRLPTVLRPTAARRQPARG